MKKTIILFMCLLLLFLTSCTTISKAEDLESEAIRICECYLTGEYSQEEAETLLETASDLFYEYIRDEGITYELSQMHTAFVALTMCVRHDDRIGVYERLQFWRQCQYDKIALPQYNYD